MSKLCSILTLLWLCSGCAATVTALKYKDLAIDTRMSDSIFLDPVAPEQRRVFLEVKSTAAYPVDLNALHETLTAKGYQVVRDPRDAQYLLQVRVLYVGSASVAAIDQSLGYGFGGPLGGALGGAAAGALIGGTSRGALIGAGIGGLLASGAELVAGSLVKVTTHSMIVDTQLSERAGKPVRQVQRASLTQGAQTTVEQEGGESSEWKRYRTRVTASATRTNLKLEDAQPELERGIVQSVAGLL